MAQPISLGGSGTPISLGGSGTPISLGGSGILNVTGNANATLGAHPGRAHYIFEPLEAIDDMTVPKLEL